MKNSNKISLSGMNINVVMNDLLRNLPFIIMAALTVLAASLAYGTIKSKPSYTSTAVIAVTAKSSSNSANAYNAIDTAISMADVYKNVLGGKAVEQRVAKDTGLDFSKITLNVTNVSSTNQLNVSVTSYSPEYAYKAVNLILNNCHTVTDELFGNAVIETVKNADIPTKADTDNNIGKYTALGMFLFAAATAGVSVYESVTRDTVKTKADARNNLEGKCIGTIMHEKKKRTHKNKKYSLLVTRPLLSSRYVESYRRISDDIDYTMRKSGGKVIAVGSVCENEGKSTVSSNIALTLVEKGKKVLLLDADFRKPSIYKMFDMPPSSATLAGYIKKEIGLEDAIKYDAKRKLYFCVNSTSFPDARGIIESDRFLKLLDYAKENMDYIIVDTAPSFLKSETRMLLDVVDASLLVVRQDVAGYVEINDEIEIRREADSEYIGYIINALDDAADTVPDRKSKMYSAYSYKYYTSESETGKEER